MRTINARGESKMADEITFKRVDLGDGHIYEGEFLNGKHFVFGKYSFPDGVTYIGEFDENSDMAGMGRLTDERSEMPHVDIGTFKGKSPNGRLLLNGIGATYIKGSLFRTGMFVDSELNGFGSEYLNGQLYKTGMFVDGKLNGFGSEYGIESGRLIKTGMFVDGKLHGYGISYSSDGKFEGQHVHGNYSKGVITYADGTSVTVEFKEGIPVSVSETRVADTDSPQNAKSGLPAPTPVVPPDGDFEVTQNTDGKTLTITKYKGPLKDIIIPGTLYGLPVTVIGESAFAGKGLYTVIIPNSVITIGDRAFDTGYLTNVIIPDSVATIGSEAFSNNKLVSLTLGKKVESIGSSAFSRNQLTSVTIPNSVTSIGRTAFAGNQLTCVIIPNSVVTIVDVAFYGNKLTSITIPNSVTSIGDSAFNDNQLTSVTIPDSVTTIGSWAFGNNKLTSVTIGANVEVGDNAFGSDNGLPPYYNNNGKKAGTYTYDGNGWNYKAR
jgi:hypothetical protein